MGGVFGLAVAADTPPRMIDAPKARFGLAGILNEHLLTKDSTCTELVKVRHAVRLPIAVLKDEM